MTNWNHNMTDQEQRHIGWCKNQNGKQKFAGKNDPIFNTIRTSSWNEQEHLSKWSQRDRPKQGWNKIRGWYDR